MRLFLVRHAESRWNLAQTEHRLYGMFSENDHGITPGGRDQAEVLCQNLCKLIAEAASGCSKGRRWDHEYTTKLLNPDVVYSSPFTRAVQTALIALQAVLASKGTLVLRPEAREQRNSLLSTDAAGVAVGDEIGQRVLEELEQLYAEGSEPGQSSSHARWLMESVKLDASCVEQAWWSASAESDDEVAERQEAFLELLRRHGEGSSIVVVGHSHFFRRFFRAYLSHTAEARHPDIAASLRTHVIPPCGVIGVQLEFPSDGAKARITEAVPLLGTLLVPAEETGGALAVPLACARSTLQCGGRVATCGGRPYMSPPPMMLVGMPPRALMPAAGALEDAPME